MDSTSDTRVVNNIVRHEYRILNDVEKHDMKKIKDIGLDFITMLDQMPYTGRELSLAKTKLEEAVMWAVKGITK